MDNQTEGRKKVSSRPVEEAARFRFSDPERGLARLQNHYMQGELIFPVIACRSSRQLASIRPLCFNLIRSASTQSSWSMSSARSSVALGLTR